MSVFLFTLFFFVIVRRTPGPTRPYTLFPYTTLFRSFTPTMTTGSVAEWREMASEAHRQAQAYENAANEILTATHANRSAFGTSAEHTRGWDSSSGSQANSSVEQFDRRTGSSTQGLEEGSTISQRERVSRSAEHTSE